MLYTHTYIHNSTHRSFRLYISISVLIITSIIIVIISSSTRVVIMIIISSSSGSSSSSSSTTTTTTISISTSSSSSTPELLEGRAHRDGAGDPQRVDLRSVIRSFGHSNTAGQESRPL